MGDELVNKSSLLQRPKDISNTALAFEPQRIRQFLVTFSKPVPPQAKPAEVAPKEEIEAAKPENLGKNDHTNVDRITEKMDKVENKENKEAETKEAKPENKEIKPENKESKPENKEAEVVKKEPKDSKPATSAKKDVKDTKQKDKLDKKN
jgi:hypothetical protein